MQREEVESLAEAVTVSRETNGIRVTVQPEFLEKQSEPDNGSYAFSYTVTIENLSDDTVQLLRRHWCVNSGGAEFLEVKGDGVIGEQPVLESQNGFRYTSGTVIKDPVGSMHGKYTFQTKGGESFEVEIPRFDLIYPHLVH